MTDQKLQKASSVKGLTTFDQTAQSDSANRLPGSHSTTDAIQTRKSPPAEPAEGESDTRIGNRHAVWLYSAQQPRGTGHDGGMPAFPAGFPT